MVAEIDVGSRPLKLQQPADGRLIVRTDDTYVAIDPRPTRSSPPRPRAMSVLRPTAAGPSTELCGSATGSVHRYDATSFALVTSLDLGFDCGQVYATPELVIPWTYNEDDGESGTSVAGFVDPATDQVQATLSLPVDTGVPIVLDDRVVLPGRGGPTTVVVDRSDWTVSGHPRPGSAHGCEPGRL